MKSRSLNAASTCFEDLYRFPRSSNRTQDFADWRSILHPLGKSVLTDADSREPTPLPLCSFRHPALAHLLALDRSRILIKFSQQSLIKIFVVWRCYGIPGGGATCKTPSTYFSTQQASASIPYQFQTGQL